jgi:phosphatidate phosphatase APP1
MKPSPTAEFGVISDMDETIIQTGLGSTLRWKVIVNTFATDSEERIPLTGAQELCNLLYGGTTGYSENPFFYLSNSPWNLFDYLSSFLEKYNFPKGPLLLRDIGLENKKKTSLLEGNKYLKTKQILEAFPELNFILIGDAEDSDAEIYLEIARNFPNRILSIYIRKVSNIKKNTFLEQLIYETKDVNIKLISTSKEAIEDARKEGYVL